LATETNAYTATAVEVFDASLNVSLSDGRSISVPLAWFPRLLHGSADERNHWKITAQGHGIHWPKLDEDISVASLLDGKPSAETQESLTKWLQQRGA
jgi:hypothetical protein